MFLLKEDMMLWINEDDISSVEMYKSSNPFRRKIQYITVVMKTGKEYKISGDDSADWIKKLENIDNKRG